MYLQRDLYQLFFWKKTAANLRFDIGRLPENLAILQVYLSLWLQKIYYLPSYGDSQYVNLTFCNNFFQPSYKVSELFIGGRCSCLSSRPSDCIAIKEDNPYTNNGYQDALVCIIDQERLRYGKVTFYFLALSFEVFEITEVLLLQPTEIWHIGVLH